MNVYDSGRMADVVAPLGYTPTDEMAEADLLILNTCHIREKATDKLFSELGRIKPLKDEKNASGGRMLLAVAGCVAQAEGEEIQRRAPYVDMVFGPQAYHQLPEMIARLNRGAGLVLNTDFPAEPKFDSLPREHTATGINAFLSIQEGCDKFCTFCVVPYTRGAEYSRPVQAIIEEAQHLVHNGARDITLLGQNVNAYHGEDSSGRTIGLGDLCYKLAEAVPDMARIRYTTSHPRDMDDRLIAAHRDLPQMMPFVHLPVQSGSDSILAAMNRKHTIDDYRRAIDRLRQARPDMAFSTDIIVGFPGESDDDFTATMKLVNDVKFALAYSFKYSRRPGTPASSMPNQIDEAIKDERLQTLQAVLFSQQKSFNESFIGKTIPVLFDGAGRHEGQAHGRSPWVQAVHVAGGTELVGQVHDVQITKASQNSVSGQVV